MKIKTINKKEKGFSLMEVIVAVAIITTALIAVISLVNFSVSGIRGGGSTIIAVSLAQEGLEIVRNIRDNNWLIYKRAPDNWRDDLGDNDWRVQYDQLGLLFFSNIPLKIDSNGFYQYNNGDDTLFYRTITIEHIPGDDTQIKVISEVTWQEKKRSRSLRAEERLYNWLES